jgi:hypothetical protein
MGIREDMPLLARHVGEWEGAYIHVDADGKEVDRHRSHLSCRITDEGDYFQVNRYTWSDGREESYDFPAAYRDRAIHFDTERMKGHAWEVDARTIVLTWTYKHDPDGYLYEMIQLSADGTDRARTWHWFEGDVLVKRTLIKERRVGD